jgi:pentatricopeptide repeat protein
LHFYFSKLNENAEEGLRDLQQLLQIENLNFAVRIGDVYSLLIEYHANRQRWKQAYAILQEMRETIPESSIRYYVNPNLLATIHRELNIEYKVPNAKPQEVYTPRNDVDNNDEDDIRDNVDFGTYDD